VALTRQSSKLWTELVAAITKNLEVEADKIASISFEGVGVAIEDDSDVLQLADGETVEVVTN
jgi:hypothetical protein